MAPLRTYYLGIPPGPGLLDYTPPGSIIDHQGQGPYTNSSGPSGLDHQAPKKCRTPRYGGKIHEPWAKPDVFPEWLRLKVKVAHSGSKWLIVDFYWTMAHVVAFQWKFSSKFSRFSKILKNNFQLQNNFSIFKNSNFPLNFFLTGGEFSEVFE